MTISLRKRLCLIFNMVLLLLTAVPVHSHNMPLGGSKWCLGKTGIIASIDLNKQLFSDITGIKERNYDLAASSDQQLQQIASEILQPYVDKKLSITVNGNKYPVKVTKLVRNENSLFTIWLSVDKIGLNKPDNTVKIDYRLLYEETNNAHLNLAYFYRTDATGDALQNIFDFSQPDGQFQFENNAPVWELSVKGTQIKSPAEHATSVSQPIATPTPPTIREKTTAQKTGSALPVSYNRRGIPANNDAATQASSSHNSATVISEVSQHRQSQDNKGAILTDDSMAKNVSEGTEKGNSKSVWSTIGNFMLLGIEHILTGYDHIAFLIGLIVIGLSIREVLKIITAFTIAHSITLLLAALQLITLSSRFVESVIAVSICYIALENLFRKEVKYRWLITFCFGLIHGFGFASALQELIVGKSNLIISVVSFNLGVETGQLMIFFVLLPVLYLLKQKMDFRRVTAGVSLAIFILGFTWLIERLFDLKLISS